MKYNNFGSILILYFLIWKLRETTNNNNGARVGFLVQSYIYPKLNFEVLNLNLWELINYDLINK